MNIEDYIIIGLLLTVLVVWWFRGVNLPKRSALKKEALEGVNERAFYTLLCQICAGRAVVLADVCLADLDRVSSRFYWFSRKLTFLRKNKVSYVIVGLSKPQLISVVQLQLADSLTASDDKNKSLNNICQNLSLPVHYFTSAAVYDIEQIENIIYPKLPPRYTLTAQGLGVRRDSSEI